MRTLIVRLVVITLAATAPLQGQTRDYYTTSVVSFQSMTDSVKGLNITVANAMVRISSGDTKYISYSFRMPPGAPGDSARRRPTLGRSPDKGFVVINSTDSSSLAPTDLDITVPRNMRQLNVTVTGKGTITISGFDGDITASTQNGAVILDHTSGTVLVDAPNGDIRVVADRLPAATSAGLELLGNNGNIILTLPASTNASVHLETQRGSLFSDFLTRIPRVTITSPQPQIPAPVRQMYGKAVSDFFVNGGGGARVRASVINGSVIVTRAEPVPPR